MLYTSQPSKCCHIEPEPESGPERPVNETWDWVGEIGMHSSQAAFGWQLCSSPAEQNKPGSGVWCLYEYLMRAWCNNIGFVVTDEGRKTILIGFSTLLLGCAESMHSEAAGVAAGLLSILWNLKAVEHYNRHALFMIFTDCLVLLLILSKWVHSNFWPGPDDVVHFNMMSFLWSKKILDGLYDSNMTLYSQAL